MLYLLIRYLAVFRTRVLLLILGVLTVSSAFLMLISASETTVATVDEELAQYWRTTYDILVRPSGTHSNIEKEYALVQVNYLGNIPGGITVEQYEAIKNIPGIEVAAPIAMLGYVLFNFSYEFDTPPPGVYDRYQKTTVETGISTLSQSGHSYSWIENAKPGEEFDRAQNLEFWERYGMNLLCKQPGVLYPETYWFNVPFLVAGIDPMQEASLVGLDQIILSGEYLPGDIPVLEFPPRSLDNPESRNLYEWVGKLFTYQVPVIFNTHSYPRVEMEIAFRELSLEQSDQTLEIIAANGKQAFLETVPISTTLFYEVKDSKELYSKLLAELKKIMGHSTDMQKALEEQAKNDPEFAALLENREDVTPPAELLFPLVSPVTYQEHTTPKGMTAPVLEAIPLRIGENRENQRNPLMPWDMPEVEYRTMPQQPYAEIASILVGSFDIDGLATLRNDLTSIPLETYFPPLVTLRYDAEGRPVEPQTLFPTLNPAGYIQQPPLALTTLEAAQAIKGDNCISAIRVRVEGIDEYTPEAQTKIEAIAAEIIRLTGLDVDVVVGSSPRSLLVYLPGMGDIPPIGYVEELWVQKGVALNISQETERGNVILLSAMLVVCTLYILNTSMASTPGRVREFGLLKSLGWRNGALAWLVLGQAAIVGLLAGGLGLGVAIGLVRLLNLSLPPERAIFIMPLSLTLCMLGSFYPAIWVTRVDSARAIQQSEITSGTRRLPDSMNYAIQGLWRRRTRSLLSLLTMATSAGLLVLIVSSIVSLSGYMNMTLLGEYILIRIQGYHYVMLSVCLLVAAISIADILLLELLERRREIGVLKAVGWRTGAVARLFLAEGLLLGMLGGLAGTILGLGIFASLYRSLPPGLAWAAAAGILCPALVGLVAALYPAWQASKIPPAEAMRYE